MQRPANPPQVTKLSCYPIPGALHKAQRIAFTPTRHEASGQREGSAAARTPGLQYESSDRWCRLVGQSYACAHYHPHCCAAGGAPQPPTIKARITGCGVHTPPRFLTPASESPPPTSTLASELPPARQRAYGAINPLHGGGCKGPSPRRGAAGGGSGRGAKSELSDFTPHPWRDA